MPQWIHSRAEHILAKNPSMPKSEAFAIATQQSHAVGKSPKGYGTAAGRSTAKSKYPTPKDDNKKANPGNLKSEKLAMNSLMMQAFSDEYMKIASEKDAGIGDMLGSVGKALTRPIPGTGKMPLIGGLGEASSRISQGAATAGKASGGFADFQKKYRSGPPAAMAPMPGMRGMGSPPPMRGRGGGAFAPKGPISL